MGIQKMSATEIKQKLQDSILEEIKKLSTDSLKKKLLLVNKVEGERNELEEHGYLKEYNHLKLQYDHKYQQYHQELSMISQGEVNGEITPEDATKYGITEEEVKETGIPEYWTNVLIFSKFFELNEKDEEVCNHMKNITLKLNDDGCLDFTVTFHFEKNDFFDHETLFKTYIYDKESFEPISATSTTIAWKEGKNPAIKIKAKKKKKGTKVETEKKEISVPSFFDLFVPEESNKDGTSEIPQQAEFIRDDLLQNQLEYYLDIYESEDDFEDEEDEEDEDESEEEGNTKSKKKGDSKKAEKCKNQ